MKFSKIYLYLLLVILVSSGFYAGSLKLCINHQKSNMSTYFGDTVVGEIKPLLGDSINNEITIRILAEVGHFYYYFFEEGLWSDFAQPSDGSGFGFLDASNENNNNITLNFKKVGSFYFWLQSYMNNFTIEIKIIHGFLGLGLALSGAISIALITLWLIKRRQILP